MTEFREASQPIVSVKDHWSDQWGTINYLWCDRLSLNVSPRIDSAVLYWTFGEIRKQNDTNFVIYHPADLLHKYVRIEYQIDEIGTTRFWYGFIAKESKTTATDPTTERRTGEQAFIAFGLEWILDRELITTSVVEVKNDDGSFGTKRIDRTIAFNQGANNGRQTTKMLPNKAKAVQGAFASDLNSADMWSIKSVVECLLETQTPRDVLGNVKLPFVLEGFPDVTLDQFILPVNVHRRTVKQVIDSLISPFRAIGYTLTVNDDNKVEFQVFSWAQYAVNLPGQGFIAANSRQHDLDLQSDLRVSSYELSKDITNTFDRTAAMGERATHTQSYDYIQSVTTGWEPEWETNYNDAGSGVAGYSAAKLDQKQNMDALVRGRSPIDRVFRHFWVREGFGAYVASTWEEATEPDVVINSWPTGLRFQALTQLQEEYDYSDGKIEDNTFAAGITGEPGFLPMFGLIKVGTFNGIDRYGFLHNLPEYSEPEKQAATDGRSWRARLSPLDNSFGFEVDTGSAPAHVFAKDDFTAALASDLALDWQADLSWKNAYFTFSLELDYHVNAVAGSGQPANDDFLMTRSIYLEDHRLDYVAPDTYVGIDENGERQQSEGGFIRDDREALAKIATLSHQWYSKTRILFGYSYRSTHVDLRPGEMIATVTDGINPSTHQPIKVEIGAVVTSIDYDFKNDTTSISTGYGEIEGAL